MDGADIFSTYFKDLSEALHSTSVADITERNWTEVEVISVMTIALQSKQFSFSYLNDCSNIRFLWELEQIFGSLCDSNLEPSILIFFFFFVVIALSAFCLCAISFSLSVSQNSVAIFSDADLELQMTRTDCISGFYVSLFLYKAHR